ncbi:CGNR zinc finger domain-containing protein [Dactylosporangium cerinum]
MAIAAVELLGGPEITSVRECALEECTRLFVDRSRAGNRAWCGMEECGNRVKAAAYRARRGAGRSGVGRSGVDQTGVGQTGVGQAGGIAVSASRQAMRS